MPQFTTLNDRAEQIQAMSDQADRRSLHGISQRLAWFFILVPGLALWTAQYWLYVEPLANWEGRTVDSLLITTVNLLLTFSFALAQAVLPPLLLSVAINNSSAQAVLAYVERKVGKTGFVFASGVGLALSVQSAVLLNDWWGTRPAFQQAETRPMTVFSMIVLIGFPAWALNRMTGRQWVEQILIAREALKIKQAIDLEQAAGQAQLVRIRALLMVDATELTAQQRAANNAEVAAILAGGARSFRRSLQMIGATMEGMTGYATNLLLEDDKEILDRYKLVTRLLNDTTRQVQHAEAYAGALADTEPDEPIEAPPPLRMDGALQRGEIVQARQLADIPHSDHFAALYEKYGREPFARREAQALLTLEKTAMADWLAEWEACGALERIGNNQSTRYRIIAGVK